MATPSADEGALTGVLSDKVANVIDDTGHGDPRAPTRAFPQDLTHFPFLELPAETRLIIHKHLLVFLDNHGNSLRIGLYGRVSVFFFFFVVYEQLH